MGRLGGPDYELAWPVELVASEIGVLTEYSWERDESYVEPLLTEAFTTTTPLEDFRHANAGDIFAGGDPWSSVPTPSQPTASYLARLFEALPSLPVYSPPRPYWNQRAAVKASDDPLLPNIAGAKRHFTRLVGRLERYGYLDRVFPKICVDDHESEEVDRGAFLDERLGIEGLWPLTPDTWTDDEFYSLVEVLHDVVARPRRWSAHTWGMCGWHFSDFSVEPARALCVWEANRMFATFHLGLELGSTGEEAGRLIRTFDDARTDLVVAVAQQTHDGISARIHHAIALFRRRSASAEDKRSATITLAGVLEEYRSVLKESLLRRDEGALFQIANEFGIRHQSASQQNDYDEAFVDWVFWWYLATVELTQRILARQKSR